MCRHKELKNKDMIYIVPLGKYKGENYYDKCINDIRYCKWILNQESYSKTMENFQNVINNKL